MEIKEYQKYCEDEILRLYASVGWTAYTERISIMCIMQLAGAGSYHKKEIGIQIFAFADMRFLCLQGANFLYM